MGELLQGRHRQHGLSSARQLHGSAVASVVALQAQSQAAAQGRELSTLAPVRALRARTLEQAWARRVVDEGVRSCPRAGCGRPACPVRGAGCGNGAMVEPVRHRETKEAATDMFEPKAAASHLDSTATTFIITHSPSRFNRRDGLSFSGERWNGFSYGRRDRVRRMHENANRNSYAACNPSLSASDLSVQPGHT